MIDEHGSLSLDLATRRSRAQGVSDSVNGSIVLCSGAVAKTVNNFLVVHVFVSQVRSVTAL